jgi:hypothetical protein
MNREIAHWLLGNVDGFRQALDGHLRKLVLVHKVPGGQENLDAATQALNRLHRTISDLLPIPPRFPLKPRKPMNAQQANIRAFVETYQAQHDHPPTFKEIAAAVGIASTGHIASNISVMVKNGWLAKVNGKVFARPSEGEAKP